MSSFRGALIGVLLSCALTQPGAAQGGQASASDSAFRRVQRLVNDGDVAAGRALGDSVLAGSPNRSPPAQLELSRGARAAAKRHLERLALEHATGVSRVQGAYWMGRVLLDEGALGPACAALGGARARGAGGDGGAGGWRV